MSKAERKITPADILSPEDYQSQRQELKARLLQIKRSRRVAVGPDATFYFENYDTMLMQIQEMLRIEKGGDKQLADELAAYNPLIPKGRELVSTLMFEIDDETRRARVLGALGGVEDTVTLTVDGEAVPAQPETDVERTTAEGKTSSVHFLHFPMSDDQVARFSDPAVQVVLGIGHEGYAHTAALSQAVREALAGDFA